MAQLIVIAFDNESDAFELRRDLTRAQSEFLLRLEDAVVVTRPNTGEYELHQAVNLTAAGALGGTFWGTLIGLLFLNPLLGAVVGAGAGALSGRLSDYGVPDDFIREIGKTVPVGSGAVFILASEFNTDKLLPRLEKYSSRARVIQTSLSDADESRLRATLAGSRGTAAGAAAGVSAASAGGAATAATTGTAASHDTASDAAGHHPTPPPRL